MSNNDGTNDGNVDNGNINEQPTAMAPAGSHESAADGQNTWQTGGLGNRETDHQATNDDEVTQRADAPGAAHSASQDDASRTQSAPGQYPPVPGSTPSNQQGQGYGSQPNGGGHLNNGQQQWNSPSNGQQYGSYGQGVQQAGGHESSPQGQGYGSGAPQGAASGYASVQGANRQDQTYGSQPGQPHTPGQGHTPGQPHGFAGNQVNPTGGNGYAGHGQQYPQQHAASTFGTVAEPTPAAGLGRKLAWGAVASALLTIVGCFGTWMFVKVSGTMLGEISASTNGVGMTSSNLPDSGSSSSDEKMLAGWIIIVLVLIPLALAALRALGRLPKNLMWAAVVFATLAEILGLYKFMQISNDVHDAQERMASSAAAGGSFAAGSGWGLSLVLIAGLALIVTSAVSALRD